MRASVVAASPVQCAAASATERGAFEEVERDVAPGLEPSRERVAPRREAIGPCLDRVRPAPEAIGHERAVPAIALVVVGERRVTPGLVAGAAKGDPAGQHVVSVTEDVDRDRAALAEDALDRVPAAVDGGGDVSDHEVRRVRGSCRRTASVPLAPRPLMREPWETLTVAVGTG